MKPGTQIGYLPPEAKGDISHESVQKGFIVDDQGERLLCYIWGINSLWSLHRSTVMEYDHTLQIKVEKRLKEIQQNRE